MNAPQRTQGSNAIDVRLPSRSVSTMVAAIGPADIFSFSVYQPKPDITEKPCEYHKAPITMFIKTDTNTAGTLIINPSNII